MSGNAWASCARVTQHQLIVILTAIDLAACLRRPQCDAVVGEHGAIEAYWLPQDARSYSPITTASHPWSGSAARPPRPRSADAPHASTRLCPQSKNSATIVPCRATSSAACSAAAPARSPDPASPPSIPARKTRTAHPRDPAPPPGGQYVPPTLPAHRWLHPGRARRPGKTQPPQQMPSAGPEPAPSCSCTPATTCTSGKSAGTRPCRCPPGNMAERPESSSRSPERGLRRQTVLRASFPRCSVRPGTGKPCEVSGATGTVRAAWVR
jgi:hypothetical protein